MTHHIEAVSRMCRATDDVTRWIRLAPLLLLGTCAPARAGPGTGTIAIVAGNVIPMTSDTVLRGYTVLVRNGLISSVGPAGSVTVPPGASVMDARGRYVVPGLIDAHVHVRAESELASYLCHGVTTIVNMRGTSEHVAMQAATGSGELAGPRLVTTGPLLDGSPPIWSGPATRVLETADDARAAVQAHVAEGYDLVKVYNNLEPELLAVVVAEAHARGLAVVGHLPRRPSRREGLDRALDAGIDMIAHGEEVFFTRFGGAPDSLLRTGRWVRPSDAEIAAVAARIREAGAAVTPNLSFIHMTARLLDDPGAVYDDPDWERLDPEVRRMWREQGPATRPDLDAFRRREVVKYAFVRRLVPALHEAGVPLLLGTDASAPGTFPGKSAHVELRELVRAGLSPYAALSAATRVPGRFLAEHVEAGVRVGTIEPGHGADLLIVRRNPLADVSALVAPETVIVRGELDCDASTSRERRAPLGLLPESGQ